MSIRPEVINVGTQKGLSDRLTDVERQLRGLQSKAGSLAPQSTPGDRLVNNTITATQVAAGTITAVQIAAATITGTLIAANTITADKLSVTQLSAITANLGTITAGTITGGTIQTSAGTGTRVVFDINGVRAYDASNVQRVNIDATTGLITATGVITAQSGSTIPTNTITGNLPGSANRYSNSAFQNGAGTSDTTGWTISNATSADGGTTVPPIYAARTLKLTASAGGTVSLQPSTAIDSFRRVVVGLSYTFSHFVYPTTNARNSSIDINWYDSSGTLLSTTAGTSQTTTLNAWTRITSTGTAPANAAYALGVHNVGLAATTSDVFYIECFQMESGDRVSAWAPRPDEILYNSINANHISVSSLSAITANLGTITAGTITGGTLQTSASDPRTVLDSTGLYVTNSSGNKLVAINATDAIKIADTNVGTAFNSIRIYDTDITGVQQGWLTAIIVPTEPTKSKTSLGVNTTTANTWLEIQRDTAADTNCHVSVRVANAANSELYARAILTGTQASDFLQLTSTAQVAANWGIAGVVFSASQTATTKTVNHGLGRSPAAVLITLNVVGSPGKSYSFTASNRNATSFDIDGWASTSTNITINVFWLAIG